MRGYGLKCAVAALLGGAACGPALAGPRLDAPAAPAVRFSTQIRPLLAAKCYRCHGPDSVARKADLRLDTEAGIRHAFAGGDPAKSLAYQRITAPDPARRMPPPAAGLKLAPSDVQLLRRWIAQGAPWEKHWAYNPPVLPPVPAIQNPKSKIQNPIDSFILARLQKAGLRPSPPAPRAKLLRRVTMDLTGLPPTQAEMDAFLADKSPIAYEKVVDRLLASPRFGERWVWEWLDAARYSDTNGYQEDRTRTMWPWRDWVIRAINRDMPYDQFIVEQIAGDLLPNATVDQRIATGFNRNNMLNGEGGRIPEESRVDYVMDRVETMGTTILGTTIGCARCHDHKYDPFTQKDYYQLCAYFNNVPETGGVDNGGQANPVLPLPTPEQTASIAALENQTSDLEARVKAAGAAAKPALQKQLDAAKKELEQAHEAVVQVMVMAERPTPRETHILVRGDYTKPAANVECGVPAVLPPLPASAPPNRLGLARWLVSPSNPLTARVEVNRVWQTLFGTGLVKTGEDFGVQGEPPSHPALLDWLACTFMATGDQRLTTNDQRAADPRSSFVIRRSYNRYGMRWSVKRLIRLIVTSATYRQDSRVTPELEERDPENRLLARGPRYRWPSFVLRDQALALSGLLVEKLGGPPVNPYQPEGVWEDFSYGKITYRQDHGDKLYRRSVYTFWRRSVAPTDLFDTAARRVCTVRLTRTNTPLQALTLLNDTAFVEAARMFAERAMKEGGRTPEQRIAWAFRLAAARTPTAKEIAVLAGGFRRALAQFRVDPAAAAKLLAVGEHPRDTSLDPAEVAAYTTATSLILNLDEVQSKE